MHQKGGLCPPFEWKRGSLQIYNTKITIRWYIKFLFWFVLPRGTFICSVYKRDCKICGKSIPRWLILVLNTILILAVWPVSESYRHSVVDIFGWYYWLSFLPSWKFVGNSFFWTIWREPLYSSIRGHGCIEKGACALLLSEKGVPSKFTILKLPTKFSTSLRSILLCDFVMYSILHTSVPAPKTSLATKLLRRLVSTMASSGFGPYHGQQHDNTPAKCIVAIPTSWVIVRAHSNLGL